MKKFIAITLTLLSTASFANQADIDQIEQASMNWQTQELKNIIDNNQGYTKALGYYRLTISEKMLINEGDAEQAIDNAIKELTTLVELDPNDAEAWALLSQCYAMKIHLLPQEMKTLGKKYYNALKTAEKLDANNPRVKLFLAMKSFHTPKKFGGSKQKALELINQSISYFEEDENSNYHWGEAEAYVWRGLIYKRLKQPTKAKADFETALEIAPNFRWAQKLLGDS